jgi:hypothetical protein
MGNKTFVVEIELEESKVRSLCDQFPNVEMNDSQKIAGLAAGAIADFADGGVTISGRVASRIKEIVGNVDYERDLVGMVEAGRGLDKCRLVGKWMVDPTYEPVLRDISASQELSIQQVVQSLMDWGVGQGWAYQMEPGVVTVFFSRRDFNTVSSLMEKEYVTGTDIAQFIRHLSEVPDFAAAK